jgi:hypothetical protein
MAASISLPLYTSSWRHHLPSPPYVRTLIPKKTVAPVVAGWRRHHVLPVGDDPIVADQVPVDRVLPSDERRHRRHQPLTDRLPTLEGPQLVLDVGGVLGEEVAVGVPVVVLLDALVGLERSLDLFVAVPAHACTPLPKVEPVLLQIRRARHFSER